MPENYIKNRYPLFNNHKDTHFIKKYEDNVVIFISNIDKPHDRKFYLKRAIEFFDQSIISQIKTLITPAEKYKNVEITIFQGEQIGSNHVEFPSDLYLNIAFVSDDWIYNNDSACYHYDYDINSFSKNLKFLNSDIEKSFINYIDNCWNQINEISFNPSDFKKKPKSALK